jgi:hypothetical protein
VERQAPMVITTGYHVYHIDITTSMVKERPDTLDIQIVTSDMKWSNVMG